MSYRMPKNPTTTNTDDNWNLSEVPMKHFGNSAVVNSGNNTTETSYRMPNNPTVTNPDERTIGFGTNQTTAIRIDDSSVDVRRTWSSAKIQSYAQTSDKELVYQFVSNYGALYFSDYNEAVYNEWTDVISDAMISLSMGEQVFVAWSPTRSAQVVDADVNSEPRMTVLIDGRYFVMSDIGIQEVPIYNVVLQYQNVESFPEVGVKDRLYIDTTDDKLYYWNSVKGYVLVSGTSGPLHKLTFGADETYVYDGTEDVTVPVYLGEYGV